MYSNNVLELFFIHSILYHPNDFRIGFQQKIGLGLGLDLRFFRRELLYELFT